MQSPIDALKEMSEIVGGGTGPYLFTRQDSSAKLSHNADITDQYEQIVCYMLPHTSARRYWLEIVGSPAPWKWRNICPHSTPGCRACCLVDSGRLGLAPAKRAMLARTALYNKSPEVFWQLVDIEIARNKKRVQRSDKRLVVRLDGTSQINIEEQAPELIEKHQDVIFQDYLKGPYKTGWTTPNRYVVSSGTERDSALTIRNRGNVVFPVNIARGKPLPTEFLGRQVVDGDKHDLRFLDDQQSVAVLVRVKGRQTDNHGFIRSV